MHDLYLYLYLRFTSTFPIINKFMNNTNNIYLLYQIVYEQQGEQEETHLTKTIAMVTRIVGHPRNIVVD